MQLTSQLAFSASPKTVGAMLTDRGFLELVCEESKATEYGVEVDGDLVKISRKLPAPEIVARFSGPTITLLEEQHWGPADAHGGRVARLSLRSPGLPVTMDGTIRLYAAAGGTTVGYSGELAVRVPLLGRSLEEAAAPALLAAINIQQVVGERWLGRA